MDCKLYLVRHGQSVANRDQLVGGNFDSPLTDKGREQAHQFKQLFQHVHFDDAYSSDLSRALETGTIIYGQAIAADHQLKGLRERTFGRLEAQPHDEWLELDSAYARKYGALPFAERLKYNYADFIESDKSLLARTIKALQGIAQNHQGQTVLVAMHGGTIRVMLMHLGYASFLAAGSFANAGYVKLGCDGRNFTILKVVGVDKAARGME